MTEIYIGDNLLDIDPRTVVAQTAKANDVGDLTTRNFNYTNQFKVPFTENNDRIYENARQHQSDTSVPYLKQVARVRQDGVDTIANGVHYLKKASDGYELFIISGAAAFFDKLGDKMLSDLNTSTINVPWDEAGITARRSSTTGVVAPVMDYGNYNTTTNNIDVMTYPPSIYYHSILDLIFTQAGYTKSGTIFSNTKFLNTIVPFSREAFKYSSSFIKARTVIASTGSQALGSVASDVTITWPTVTKADDFGFFNGATGEYSATEAAAINGDILFLTRVTLQIDMTVTGGNVNVYVEDTYGGDFSVLLQNKGTGIYSRSTDFADGTIAINLPAVKTGKIRVRVVQFNAVPASVTINSANLIIECIDKIYNGAGTGQPYTYMNELMPDMSQKDFVKDFAIRYGQLFKEANGVISCKGIDEIILDRANAKDWTSKRIRNPDQISFTPDTYAQTNYFTYKVNEDEGISATYGRGELTVANLNAPIQKTIYQTPFYASLTKQVGGVFMMVVPIYDTSTSIDKFDKSPGLRIALVRDKYSYEPSVTYSGAQSSYKVAYFDDPLQSSTMLWSQFLTDHYPYFKQMLQKSKTITREYILDASDMANLDFFVPVFDEDAYFLLNTVGPYVAAGKPTKVELIKI